MSNICSSCSGNGKVTCPGCGGRGSKSLNEGQQSKIVNCAGCNGSGYRSCGRCGGSGRS